MTGDNNKATDENMEGQRRDPSKRQVLVRKKRTIKDKIRGGLLHGAVEAEEEEEDEDEGEEKWRRLARLVVGYWLGSVGCRRLSVRDGR